MAVINQSFTGHPMDPATFMFTETHEGRDGRCVVIKSHVAYDSRWPWWRRWWADIRGRP